MRTFCGTLLVPGLTGDPEMRGHNYAEHLCAFYRSVICDAELNHSGVAAYLIVRFTWEWCGTAPCADAELLRFGGGGCSQSAEAFCTCVEPAEQVQLKVWRGTALIQNLWSDSVLWNT